MRRRLGGHGVVFEQLLEHLGLVQLTLSHFFYVKLPRIWRNWIQFGVSSRRFLLLLV